MNLYRFDSASVEVVTALIKAATEEEAIQKLNFLSIKSETAPEDIGVELRHQHYFPEGKANSAFSAVIGTEKEQKLRRISLVPSAPVINLKEVESNA